MKRTVNLIMNDPKYCYYGHGTVDSDVVINSIFKYGLRCSHNDMYYTTITLGIGGQIPEQVNDLFDKWPHHGYNNIIIVALPTDYHIIDSPGIGTYQERYGAFCYVPDEQMQKQGRLTNSRYVRPEFIVGCYNTKTDNLRLNRRYFRFMYPQKREEFEKQIKEKYLNIIDNACGILEYKELVTELNGSFPISDEEIGLLTK